MYLIEMRVYKAGEWSAWSSDYCPIEPELYVHSIEDAKDAVRVLADSMLDYPYPIQYRLTLHLNFEAL